MNTTAVADVETGIAPAACALPIPIAMPETRSSWSYREAFGRNQGLISPDEQEKLRHSRVAIAGMGGVGAVHLITLARMGVGKFTIADPDVFAVANFNRQYGATIKNLGRKKAEAMAEAAQDINPELDLRVFKESVNESNVDEFLKDSDLFVDGLDFFAIDARRLVFRRAAERGMWAITAGPIGFSTAWLVFDPNGMPFDSYFDLRDQSSRFEKLVAFAVGLSPRATHLPYIDLSQVSIADACGPSAALACQLASGVMCNEVLTILLGRSRSCAAPTYQQFDPYEMRYVRGRLPFGNRSIGQRLKRYILSRRMKSKIPTQMP